MGFAEDVKDIRDALLPNYPYNHPRVEVVSSQQWKLIATFHANVAVWYLHIIHTGNGDGVQIAFTENPEVKDVIGPFFGDNPLYPPAPDHITHPTTERKRRTRPKHIYAKLDSGFWVPGEPEPGEAREHGPLVSIEEWFFWDKEGQTDESLPLDVRTSTTSYLSQIEKQQKELMEREG